MKTDKEKPPHFEDIDLWDKVKETVKPLKKDKASLLAISPPKKQAWEATTAVMPLGLNAFGEKRYKRLKLHEKDLSIGDLSAMDGRNAERLRKGKMHFDGRLDLHGFTADKAWIALKNFIIFSYQKNRRCILVITGKGWKAKDGIGVLRSQLPRWLNSPDVQPFILGFSRAQDKDGGDGAFYIMLKKNRSSNSTSSL